jgi:hypothetical protein
MVFRQDTKKRGVTRQKGDLATTFGACNHLRGIARKQHALG